MNNFAGHPMKDEKRANARAPVYLDYQATTPTDRHVWFRSVVSLDHPVVRLR